MTKYFNYLVNGIIVFLGLSIIILAIYSHYGELPRRYNKMHLDCINQPPAHPFFKNLLSSNKSTSCSKESAQQFLLGTDPAGRDILSRVLKSIDSYFFPAILSVLISLFGGILIGVGKSYPENMAIRSLSSFITDVIETIPGFVLVLFVIALYKPNIWTILLVVGVLNIPKFSAQIADQINYLKKQDFVDALTCFAASFWRILGYHLLYLHCRFLILFQMCLAFIQALIYETSLSYLGIGIQEPLPSLGNMVAIGKDYFFRGNYWISGIPALAICLCVILFYLLAALFYYQSTHLAQQKQK